jgi:alkanesulfonate monooxygenase SsuD/methylene tetrahydromethanopterin reductase-like flavin-dependent oxidoreductase (luciferase family)
MKVGLQIPYFTYPGSAQTLGDTFAQIARDADSTGFYSLWVMDHFFQVGGVGPKEREMLESYSTLAFAAGITSRIKLGALVTGVTYRYPGILVKTVTTLDVLSGGRAYLGVGAAWNEAEHRGLGVPFHLSPSASRCLRKRYRSLVVCGGGRLGRSARSEASTSRWRSHSTCRRL